MKEICRICLKSGIKDLISLYFYVESLDKTYFQMYDYISGVTPCINYYNCVCKTCAEVLSTAFMFKEKIEENEKLFNEFMEGKTGDLDEMESDPMMMEPNIEMIVVEDEELIELKEEPLMEDEWLDATQKLKIKKRNQNDEEEEIQCVLCSYNTTKKANFQKHVERTHKRQKMKCDGCNETFHLIYILEKHRQTEHGFHNKYEVDVSFNYLVQLPEIEPEKLPIIECPLCEYKSTSKDNYGKHVKRKHNRQSLLCDGCEESFHLIHVLDQHRREKHGYVHRYEVDETLKISRDVPTKKKKTEPKVFSGELDSIPEAAGNCN